MILFRAFMKVDFLWEDFAGGQLAGSRQRAARWKIRGTGTSDPNRRGEKARNRRSPNSSLLLRSESAARNREHGRLRKVHRIDAQPSHPTRICASAALDRIECRCQLDARFWRRVSLPPLRYLRAAVSGGGSGIALN
jgi:hypothetical protein